jgi:hypothetical protein
MTSVGEMAEKDLELGRSPSTGFIAPPSVHDGTTNDERGSGNDNDKSTPSPLPAGQDTANPLTPTASVKDDPRYIVAWEPNDPDNPQNWSGLYKSWVTFQLSMLALAASVASSMIAPAGSVVAKQIGVSENLVVLNVSLFV